MMKVFLMSPPYLSDLETGKCSDWPVDSDIYWQLKHSLIDMGYEISEPAWEVRNGYLICGEITNEKIIQSDFAVLELNLIDCFFSQAINEALKITTQKNIKSIAIVGDFCIHRSKNAIDSFINIISNKIDLLVPIYSEPEKILEYYEIKANAETRKRIFGVNSLPNLWQDGDNSNKDYFASYIGSPKRTRTIFFSKLIDYWRNLPTLYVTGGRVGSKNNNMRGYDTFIKCMTASQYSINSCAIASFEDQKAKSLDIKALLPGRVGQSISAQCIPIWLGPLWATPEIILKGKTYLQYDINGEGDINQFLESLSNINIITEKTSYMYHEWERHYSPKSFWQPIINRLGL
ncbi:hypothetical protein [Rheinheimera tilapiae]|jgi:hypothetical protein|uniref:Glycosyltransferase family 1 protein n=1 Tax=Rheinheimera tilapiae TaxID=875043 RepID=A0ABV6BHB8_9GAMM